MNREKIAKANAQRSPDYVAPALTVVKCACRHLRHNLIVVNKYFDDAEEC